MKNILFVLITFMTFNLFAQRSGGGRGRGQQGQRPLSDKSQKVKKFKATDVAGIFYYDIEKVVRKLKIKDEKKQYSIRKVLKNYNFKVKEISFLNSEKFSGLDVLVNSLPKVKNSEASVGMRKKVEEVIRPIRDEIHENEIELNQAIQNLLSEKQTKKWLKYQKKKKQSLQPKRPQNNNRQGFRPKGGAKRRQ